jgi:Cys-tRNA(Pro)/Cys-tRNA(Cys) deacylase
LEVDLKLLAKAVGEKKLLLATQRQAEQITGLLSGGISPLALLNRGFEVVLDELSDLYEEIYISGGQRGLIIRLPTRSLIALTDAKRAGICT